MRRACVCPPITPGGAHDARARTEGVSDAYAYADDAHDARASRATAKLLFTIACEAFLAGDPTAPARVDEALRLLHEAEARQGEDLDVPRDTRCNGLPRR